MKILMINIVCGIRSTGRICTDLAAELEKRGHVVKIAYGRETVPDRFARYAVRIGSDRDVKLHGLYARCLDGCGFGSRKATLAFIEWVKAYDPDIIHLHNLHGYYLNLPVLFSYLRTCKKRIIWTLHDCWAFTGHSAYCDVIDCVKWKTGCRQCLLLGSYPKSYIDRSEANWFRKKEIMTGIPGMQIVTPSGWLANMVSESFLAEYPVQVIHNGIDTTVFQPAAGTFRERYGLENKIILLGVATAWDDMKGLSDYIRLAERLEDQYAVVLVGLTAEQKEKLSPRMIGIERTDSVHELAEIYSAADLFLNLSYCENYPTVNLESIACDTPVLTYRTGGSPESALQFGAAVERGDLDAVLYAIRFFHKPEKKGDIELDRRIMLNHYIDVYESRSNRGHQLPGT